jgi:hypothetical protein
VCHPTWLLRDPDHKPVVGRHHLFMATYSYEILESFLLAYLERSQADDWSGIAEKLSRLGHWEFEDYTP